MKYVLALLFLVPFLVYAQTPVNDEPCEAINIPVVAAANCTPTTIYQWANATFSTGGTSNPSCAGFTSTTKDVWYKFTPTSSYCTILFNKAYTNSLDLGAAVYDAESCSFFYSFSQCNDDDGPDAYPQFVFSDFIPGATYYLRLWNYSAVVDSGSAKICIISEPLASTIGKLGLNTLYPTAPLDVNGTVKIRGGAPALNKVLTSDAYGNGSWKAIPVPTKIAFGTYQLQGINQSIPANTYTKILFGEAEETGVANIASGVFTAPETATYHFETAITFTSNNTATFAVKIVIKNAGGTVLRNYETRENNLAATSEKTITATTTVALSAGQTAEVQFFQTSASPFLLTNSGSLGIDRKTRFQGYKIF